MFQGAYTVIVGWFVGVLGVDCDHATRVVCASPSDRVSVSDDHKKGKRGPKGGKAAGRAAAPKKAGKGDIKGARKARKEKVRVSSLAVFRCLRLCWGLN
jgi:hypothetical protein